MAVIDTNVAIERLRRGEEIHENITGVTFVEFPRIVKYSLKGMFCFQTLTIISSPMSFRKNSSNEVLPKALQICS